ncbi:MAG: pyridoxal-phosphate dependent enzyme [Anaerolineales bacterium]|nr:pyridoxal-phosphate dependent enzyme [Anaerolineales bacterium]
MIPNAWFEDAAKRIKPYIQPTPLTFDRENNIFLKWENHQKTGSFKLRGALNKILSLQEWEIKQGLVTASAGNHGQGVAMAANLVNAQVTIFASDHAVPAKLEAMRSMGVNIILIPDGYSEAEKAGIIFAKENHATWISPYNDGQIIAGQGTIALEVLEDMPAASAMTWIVPVGGGGLISGIGAVIKENIINNDNLNQSQPSDVILVGVQPEASSFMHAIYKVGNQIGVEDLPTLADGLSGAVEEGSITIPMVRKYVDDIITVSESEITHAIAFAWNRYREKIEGSAAVSLAAILTKKCEKKPAVLILSGGNIQKEVFDQIVG